MHRLPEGRSGNGRHIAGERQGHVLELSLGRRQREIQVGDPAPHRRGQLRVERREPADHGRRQRTGRHPARDPLDSARDRRGRQRRTAHRKRSRRRADLRREQRRRRMGRNLPGRARESQLLHPAADPRAGHDLDDPNVRRRGRGRRRWHERGRQRTSGAPGPAPRPGKRRSQSGPQPAAERRRDPTAGRNDRRLLHLPARQRRSADPMSRPGPGARHARREHRQHHSHRHRHHLGRRYSEHEHPRLHISRRSLQTEGRDQLRESRPRSRGERHARTGAGAEL